jgi:hypothetical protein
MTEPTYLLAAENEQVRVLGDDPVDIPFSLEETELRIGLVGRYDVVDILRTKRLQKSR